MKISSRFSVAVHILLMLALKKDTGLSSDAIASSVNTNPVVIRRIIGLLKKAQLVSVTKGAGGAARLQKEVGRISLLDVYRAVEVVEAGELFNVHGSSDPACPVGGNIEAALRGTLLRAQEQMESVLAEVCISELVGDMTEKKISTLKEQFR